MPEYAGRTFSTEWASAIEQLIRAFPDYSAERRFSRYRNNFDSVLTTKELFLFKEMLDADGVVTKHLELGAEKNPVGFLDFNAHRDYAIPKQITVRHSGRHWWLISAMSMAHQRASCHAMMQNWPTNSMCSMTMRWEQ